MAQTSAQKKLSRAVKALDAALLEVAALDTSGQAIHDSAVKILDHIGFDYEKNDGEEAEASVAASDDDEDDEDVEDDNDEEDDDDDDVVRPNKNASLRALKAKMDNIAGAATSPAQKKLAFKKSNLMSGKRHVIVPNPPSEEDDDADDEEIPITPTPAKKRKLHGSAEKDVAVTPKKSPKSPKTKSSSTKSIKGSNSGLKFKDAKKDDQPKKGGQKGAAKRKGLSKK